MTWKEQAPLLYVAISVVAAISFAVAMVIAIRRQPHRFKRIRRFLCCIKDPLHSYTSVEEEDPFVIDNEDDEGVQEIELPIAPKEASKQNPDTIQADTV